MENSLKGLMMAAGVVVTCVIIGLGFYMMREAQSTAKAAGDEMGQLRYRLEEAEYGQYDGLEIIGADLTNLIKKELGSIYTGDVPDVKITVSGGKGTYTYRDNTYLYALQDSTSEKYIEPLSVFTGKVMRDSNRAVTEIIFNVKRR